MWSQKCADCSPDPFRLQSTTTMHREALCYAVLALAQAVRRDNLLQEDTEHGEAR